MKMLVLCCLFLGCAFEGSAQLISLADGQYIDTSGKLPSDCPNKIPAYYYQVGGKYPRSSNTLLEKARSILDCKKVSGESGYLTFQFLVDCSGTIVRRVKVLQTNSLYQEKSFDFEMVNKYYNFLLTLTGWQPGLTRKGTTIPYHAFITFKIKDGTLENIIP